MDQSRFEHAWNRHSAAILRYCMFSVGSRQDAEDLAAETFSRLLRSGDDIQADKLEAWLFTVARNLCTSHQRSESRSRDLLGRMLAADPPRTTAAPADAWHDPELWQHVRSLDERSRLAIYLRIAEDRTFATVAEIMSVSQSAAKMTYYRALERLRDSIAAAQALGERELNTRGSTSVSKEGITDVE